MKKVLIAILLVAGLCNSCGPQVGPRDVVDADFQVPGPAPIVRSVDDCKPACQQLKKLGCEAGDDFVDGTTCQQFCEETIKNGVWLNPDCIAQLEIVTAPKCPEIEVCATEEKSSTFIDKDGKIISIAVIHVHR